ncbi:MAG: hypothetical protein HZA88_19830 [Verrucomicrobia bacterium]|nr:hypothetical protein [Verrucomicrobiota bacterium]
MKLSHYIAFIAAVALFAGCGDKGSKVQQPAKGPAVTVSGTNTVAKSTVTPAPPPPVTTPKPVTTLFPADSPNKTAPTVSVPSAAAQPAPTSVKPVTEAKATQGQMAAKVVMVNKEMKFVVLEFSTSAVPIAGSQLSLYRGTERVATVKASEPMKPPLVTADILDGDPRKGDEIK